MMKSGALSGSPFGAELTKLAAHGDGCRGPESGPEFVDFADRPALPDPDRVDAGLVLITGLPGVGKSVFAHRCLHVYEQAGHYMVDLGDVPASEVPDPVTCLDLVLDRLHREEVLSRRKLESIGGFGEPNPVEEHKALGNVLGGRQLVIRLPAPDPLLSPAAVAREVVAYARSAVAAHSVYLFEFPYWPDDQRTLLRRQIAQQRGLTLVHGCELAPYTPAELAAFVRARCGAEIFAFDPEEMFGMFAGNGATVGLAWFNALCGHAVDQAISDGADRLDRSHFLAALLRTGAP
jgi:hypothetical protein